MILTQGSRAVKTAAAKWTLAGGFHTTTRRQDVGSRRSCILAWVIIELSSENKDTSSGSLAEHEMAWTVQQN